MVDRLTQRRVGLRTAGSAYGSAASAYPSAYSSPGARPRHRPGSGSAVGKTTNYGNAGAQRLAAVDAARVALEHDQPRRAPLGGGVDTTTILRADLKALQAQPPEGLGLPDVEPSASSAIRWGNFGVKR
jgi:hypothetical protein